MLLHGSNVQHGSWTTSHHCSMTFTGYGCRSSLSSSWLCWSSIASTVWLYCTSHVNCTVWQTWTLNGDSVPLQRSSWMFHQQQQQQCPFKGPLSGTTKVSWYQKGTTNLDILEQERVSGSGINWAICKSAP